MRVNLNLNIPTLNGPLIIIIIIIIIIIDFIFLSDIWFDIWFIMFTENGVVLSGAKHEMAQYYCGARDLRFG